MAQQRSADPWSSFLEPGEGGRAAAFTHFTAPRAHEEAQPELPTASRAVLDLVTAEGAAVAVEDIAERLGYGLLEVADALRPLTSRELVKVRRDGAHETVAPAEHRAAD